MSKINHTQALIEFIDKSPTPFHAVENMRQLLLTNKFVELREDESWSLEASGQYFTTRNGSSIVAFRVGDELSRGFRMIGAHTDSPCLRLKPNPTNEANGYVTFGVEVYGGALLNPWFDRDLSIGGRVVLKKANGDLVSSLVNLEEPVAFIPSLAIHLDRDANNKRSINAQTMLPPLVGMAGNSVFDFSGLVLQHLLDGGKCGPKDLLSDFELSLFDINGGKEVGANREFLASARLDNLLSCWLGLQALLTSRSKSVNQLIVCNDHEEVGSGSFVGAKSNFLSGVLRRLSQDEVGFQKMIAKSLLVSTDNAHALHPNFPEKHDSSHGPLINQGPVLKINSNQAYATNSESAALLRSAATRAGLKLQNFVVRSDMACGSTIGPLTASQLGIRTVDVGVPTFGMHSVRELAGCKDIESMRLLLEAVLELDSLVVEDSWLS